VGQRGGKRPGAGRKKGGQNKLTKAQLERAEKIAAEAAKNGLLPHQILFELGKGAKVPGFEKAALGVNERVDCLKACAPFYAPKLLAAVVKTPGPNEQNPWAQILDLVQGTSRGLPAEASKRALQR
jgi:hypothetical protein